MKKPNNKLDNQMQRRRKRNVSQWTLQSSAGAHIAAYDLIKQLAGFDLIRPLKRNL